MVDTKYKYDHFKAIEWFDTQMNLDDNMLHKVEKFLFHYWKINGCISMSIRFGWIKWTCIAQMIKRGRGTLFQRQRFSSNTGVLISYWQCHNGTITVNYSYRSPAGRNYYENEVTIDFQAYLRRVEAQQKQDRQRENQDALAHYQPHSGGFDKNAWARQQRAKMTPRLRYRILRRDGFVCQICGRGQADGVVLHVDYIKPVSKGGKTEPDNLRTLCDQCNLGKGALYREDGPN